ncbi:MAG: PQQ-binding-like beta-propeller repeat protein [Planctomycetia bacterium]|nr:PQQ-binding-like beta-propeller repeat protein [Planctomycetia bacterium]
MTLSRIALVGLLLPVFFGGNPAAGDAVQPVAVDPHGDPLPPFARARLGTVRFRHGSAIQQVRYLKGGQVLLSVGVDGSLRHWDAATGKEIHAFTPPFNAFTGQSGFVSPDGLTTASYEQDGSIRLWDVATSKELRRLKSAVQQFGAPAYSPDSKSLAVVVTDLNTGQGIVRMWDIASGKELRDFTPSVNRENMEVLNLLNVFFSPNGKVIGALGQDNEGASLLRLWDAATGRELPKFATARRNAGLAPAFALDGQTAALTTIDLVTGGSKVQVLDVATGKVAREIEDGDGNGAATLFAPDGKVLAVIAGNQLPKLWNLATGKELPALETGDNMIASALAFAPDSRTVAVGMVGATGQGSIFLCDVASGKKLHELKGYQDGYGNVRVQFNDGGMGIAPSLAFSPDGKRLAGTGMGGSLRLWNTSDGKEWRPVQGGHDGEIHALALSADGKRLATAGYDLTVRIWDVAAGQELLSLKPPEPMQNQGDAFDVGPTAVAFAPDGKSLAISWMDGALQLRDLATGKELRQCRGHESSIHSLVFHPNGKTLASSDGDGRVFWWDAATGRQLKQLAGPVAIDPNNPPLDASGIAPALALSPDGRLLAGAGPDAGRGLKVQLWELATGKLRRQIKVSTGRSGEFLGVPGGFAGAGVPAAGLVNGEAVFSTGISFTPDGRFVGLTVDDTVRLLDLATGQEVRQFGGQDGILHGVKFSPDGKLLAAAASGGAVRLWEVATGTVLTDLKGHRGTVNDLTFTPNGHTLISAASDTTVLLWDYARALEAAKTAPPALTEAELAGQWKFLAGDNGEQADQAIARLSRSPALSLPWLKGRLKAVPAIDEKQVRRLLADIESERFETRKQAGEDLEKLAELAEPYLVERLKGNPSLEARQRLEQLLEKLGGPLSDPEQVQALRGVEVLERIATPDAKSLLAELAKGAPSARLTQEAQAALQRLK